jgi:hypothetical protein
MPKWFLILTLAVHGVLSMEALLVYSVARLVFGLTNGRELVPKGANK